MYDKDNDGVLIEDDLYQVLRAMMTENGMQLKVEEVRLLANVLFTDGCKEEQGHLTLDDFKEQLSRQDHDQQVACASQEEGKEDSGAESAGQAATPNDHS